jgi:hypothetical protein
MWHTPCGNRTLVGAEATLVKMTLTAIVERMMEESAGYLERWEYGIALFDQLPLSQRLALLEQVATFLLTDTTTSIELTAVNEAAVGVIFEHAREEIDREIEDGQAGTEWRELALAAYAAGVSGDAELALSDEEQLIPPLPASRSWEQWNDVIESLADRILWDRDYELGELFMDAPPSKSRLMKQSLGIDADYFAAAAPDADVQDGIQATYQRLAALARGGADFD